MATAQVIALDPLRVSVVEGAKRRGILVGGHEELRVAYFQVVHIF
jgi:hypothetical protein